MNYYKVLIAAFFCMVASVASFAIADSTATIKKGWNFGVLPAVSFDSDLGFEYGGLVNAYYYGDGTRYPKYNHSMYFEASNTTKGNGILRFFYDSDTLIRGFRFSADVSLLDDQAYPFYGFNGQQSIYNSAYTNVGSALYKSELFYNVNRKLIRCEPVLQHVLYKKIKWVAGVGLYHYDINSLNLDKLNKGRSGSTILPDSSLYNTYVQDALIPSNLKHGGYFNHVIVGLAYDSRDNFVNPNRGMRDEAIFGYAPSLFGNPTSGAKLMLIHRQYITLVPKKLTFCYRVAWQSNMGNVPWYAQQLMLKSYPMSDYSEGLGGAKTIRGVLLYRLNGKDFAYTNLEFRYMFAHAKVIKQNFHLALNPFYDAGMITRFDNINTALVPQNQRSQYFTSATADVPHQGYGCGLRVIMNENFVVAFEYGRAVRKIDGTSSLYINLNFLF